ncbi:tolloid-like protein 2 [Amphiura filiformis]|uniref:tolloid-like protein 2 n=1 Tax=Amphiura filiformis TaxID=82378 RepID=UPI003B214B4F
MLIEELLAISSRMVIDELLAISSRMLIEELLAISSRMVIDELLAINSIMFIDELLAISSRMLIEELLAISSRMLIDELLAISSSMLIDELLAISSRMLIEELLAISSRMLIDELLAISSVCGTEMTDVAVGESFNITTPNYPYFYPDNIDCTWTFVAIESAGSFAIHFLEFDTQQEYDPLSIGKSDMVSYDNTIYQFSGVVPSHVVLVIEERAVWLTFHSDIIGTFTGIDLVIERIQNSVPCKVSSVICNTGDSCIEEMLLCSHYPVCLNTTQNCDVCDEIDFSCVTSPGCVDKSLICNGIRHCLDGSDEWECQTCGSVINDLAVIGPIYLTTPGYPSNYPPNTDCTWVFTDTTPGTYIITIVDFATEWVDNFMVGYGTTVSTESQGVRISVWYFPKTIVVEEMDMWVRFASNGAVEFSGFLVEVAREHEQVTCLPNEFECATGYGCLDPALYCNVAGECMDRSDENVDICIYCPNTTISLESNELVDIISPFYPSYYPLSVDCFWRITSQQQGGFIAIEFLTVSLSYRNDFLTIGVGQEILDSAIIFRLTGTGGPRFTSVNDSTIWLRLKTDQWGQLEIGFFLKIQWQETFTPCDEGEFLCATGYGCLENKYVCDSIGQCLDASDEDGCALCGVQLEFSIAPSDVFNISSPWYPRQYPLTQDCHWLVTTPTPGNIIATFFDFDTGPGHDKLYFASLNYTIPYDVDHIVVGKHLQRFTGRYFPRSVVVPWTDMQIAWDASVWTAGGRGFALELSWSSPDGMCM